MPNTSGKFRSRPANDTVLTIMFILINTPFNNDYYGIPFTDSTETEKYAGAVPFYGTGFC